MYHIDYVKFEWDEKKNRMNRLKHGIWFEEATSVFDDPLGRLFQDSEHSQNESRFYLIGHSSEDRLLVVFHCERGHGRTIRIISARRVTKKERAFYEKRN